MFIAYISVAIFSLAVLAVEFRDLDLLGRYSIT
jgi:hypothetical protein